MAHARLQRHSYGADLHAMPGCLLTFAALRRAPRRVRRREVFATLFARRDARRRSLSPMARPPVPHRPFMPPDAATASFMIYSSPTPTFNTDKQKIPSYEDMRVRDTTFASGAPHVADARSMSAFMPHVTMSNIHHAAQMPPDYRPRLSVFGAGVEAMMRSRYFIVDAARRCFLLCQRRSPPCRLLGPAECWRCSQSSPLSHAVRIPESQQQRRGLIRCWRLCQRSSIPTATICLRDAAGTATRHAAPRSTSVQRTERGAAAARARGDAQRRTTPCADARCSRGRWRSALRCRGGERRRSAPPSP